MITIIKKNYTFCYENNLKWNWGQVLYKTVKTLGLL